MSEVKKPMWIECEVDCDENYFHLEVVDIEGHDQGQEFDNSMKIEFIEKSAAESRDIALRCMQQMLKANGSMTYQQFLTNLSGCGLTEEELGEYE